MTQPPPPHRLVSDDGNAGGPLADWPLTERVASTLAVGAAPRIDPERARQLTQRLHQLVAEADPVARRAAHLGAELPPASALIVGRRGWIRSNVATLAWLTDPVADQLLRRSGVSRSVTRQAMAVQVGVLLGYLAARVLGQYEALRPDPQGRPPDRSQTPGRLLLIGPNLLAAAEFAEGEGVAADDLYRGVVLHELAHRLQFEGVDWLRPHLWGLVEDYLGDARVDADRVRELARRVPELLRDPEQARDPQRWLALVLTPRQQEVLERAQSLMTLLEGHGNAVMDWGAADAGAFDPGQVRGLLRRRRGRVLDRLARDALGLSMKARQYAVGERFVLDVASRYGVEAFNRVWDDPANLPRADELDQPDDWMARLDG